MEEKLLSDITKLKKEIKSLKNKRKTDTRWRLFYDSEIEIKEMEICEIKECLVLSNP